MDLIGTFIEGLLSFLSPCVLPLIPLYMAYLSNDARSKDEDGNWKYDQIVVFFRTLCFVFGILIAISLLALAVDSLKNFISDYQDIIGVVASVIIFIFGLHETGIIEISVLNKEASLSSKLHLDKMNYFKAVVFGFLFTFAWSPCIGPMLSSALLLSISSETGYLYLVAYGLGFVIPFIVCGLATGFILNLLKKYQKALRYVNIVAGVILMGFAVYMFYSASNNIIDYKNVKTEEAVAEKEEQNVYYLEQDEYLDQDGNTIRISDYQGKFLIVNYVTTWCTYCKSELPEFMEFCNENDVGCALIMSPDANGEDAGSIKEYHDYYEMNIPIIVDSDNYLLYKLGISSYPTTWIIGPDSSLVGYQLGAMPKDGFIEIYEKAIELYNER